MAGVRYRKVILFQNPASGAPNPETRNRIRARLEAISDSVVEIIVDRDLDLGCNAGGNTEKKLMAFSPFITLQCKVSFRKKN